jgi:ZF-HD class homeobox domain-containing protein
MNNSSHSFSRNAIMRYKECLKNHAAAIGGNATDGCGEFMPNGDEGTIEAFKCSACNCHRNFHRKETESSDYPSPFSHTPLIGYPTNTMIMSYKSGSVPPSESDDQKDDHDYGGGGVVARPAEKVIIRKRFRTKFTKEQKEKMLSFAEKAGWRMQKLEESAVQHFCQEIGIKRSVLKVWMHNNKHSLAKKN